MRPTHLVCVVQHFPWAGGGTVYTHTRMADRKSAVTGTRRRPSGRGCARAPALVGKKFSLACSTKRHGPCGATCGHTHTCIGTCIGSTQCAQ